MSSIYNYEGSAVKPAYAARGAQIRQAYALEGTPIPFDVFKDTAVLTTLGNVSVSGTKQGACTDGEYIYQIIIGTSFSFIKYKIADGTYTTVSKGSSIPFNHGNDMTYNPNNGHIYVASMSSDGSVMELDKEFNLISTHYLVKGDGASYAVWGLCFDKNTGHFLSEIGNTTMGVYDQDFNFLGSFSMPAHPSATGQGCETDGDYIYRVTYNPNLIDVATIRGEYVATIANPMSGEPETMMYDWSDNKYYMNRNTSGSIFYELGLKK